MMKKIISLLLALLMICCVMSAVSITSFAAEQLGEKESQSPITFDDSMQGMGKGAALSDGSLTIIVGVVSAVVFGFGGFFIGKAVGKKSALTDGAENKKEE